MRAILSISIFMSTLVQASPLNYEVLFTHPSCSEKQFVSYRDPQTANTSFFQLEDTDLDVYQRRSAIPFRDVGIAGIPTIGGGVRSGIPANVYCTSADKAASITPADQTPLRETDSPFVRIQEWVNSVSAGDKLFVASMSFSDKDTARAICSAAERGAQVKLFIQKPRENDAVFNLILACKKPIDVVTYSKKGRLAHMKTFVIEYSSLSENKGTSRITFQSGNISTGLWGHHENWNFVTTASSHWFAEEHFCLRDSLGPDTVANLGELYQEMNRCRELRQINSRRYQDQDIEVFMVPFSTNKGYNDKKELRLSLAEEVQKAQKIKIAAHHLTDRKLIAAIKERLVAGELEVELLLDDELYWTKYSSSPSIVAPDEKQYFSAFDYSRQCNWGKTRNQVERSCSLFNYQELDVLQLELIALGAQVKFFEANHVDRKLFHNKFIIFNYDDEGETGSVFTGAGNLSKAGFERNFENYYLVRLQSTFNDFNKGFQILWDKASYVEDMPITWDFKVKDAVPSVKEQKNLLD